MDSCTLNWHADRGFELDVDVSNDEMALKMMGVPVPADGTIELAEGVELDRLEILFKAQVDIEGVPGQVHEATVRLAGDKLLLDAKLEDVETGDILPLQATFDVALPSDVPERGGPKPVPTNEDELDWEDETTIEKMVMQPPEVEAVATGKSGRDTESPSGSAGLQALLKALVDGPDDDFTEEHDLLDLPEPVKPLPPGLDLEPAPEATPDAPAEPAAEPEAEPEPGDQSMSAEGEAKSLLDLLVRGEHLELEEDHDTAEMAAGAAEILELPISPEKKATHLSEWLLEQDAVADLYIGDDDLAEILTQW